MVNLCCRNRGFHSPLFLEGGHLGVSHFKDKVNSVSVPGLLSHRLGLQLQNRFHFLSVLETGRSKVKGLVIHPGDSVLGLKIRWPLPPVSSMIVPLNKV